MNVNSSGQKRISTERIIALILIGYLAFHSPILTQALSQTVLKLIPATIMALTYISGLLAVVGLWRQRTWGYLPVLFFIPSLTLFSGVLSFDGSGLLFQDFVLMLVNIGVFLFAAWGLMQKMDAA
ncbi:hypothetical protein CW749_03260 [Vibrio sp. vnigr-6D03]|uniref:DUF2069 domain-containing protein n=1 Tax=Vibrio penaeicida TaxID=104609 RepID=A0AAV5NXU7_9VIBR|nr:MULTISPECIES: hypothetical protein [Vibrio]MDP2574029.1 hypothetical protein [Vibrio penaeicida]PKF80806.1 hypothetical protein CW749_03260 [Vibrio sp. vnigr-6D03]RTZ24964.1 hypothetical protein EKN09_00640 [Vibrio penaeicida]GLQ75134.1 hypothetical protein GCM10007932_44960 [Vibrio penaeicida]